MAIYKQINEDITDESIYPIIEAINDANAQVKFVIGITSEGGHSYNSRFLLSVLNNPSNVKRITLVCLDKCYSAAFDIFFKFKGKKQIALGSRGMLHYDSIDIRHCHSKQAKNDDELQTTLEQLDHLRDETLRLTKSILNDDELKLLKSGSDVYFSFNRMLEIFPDIEVV